MTKTNMMALMALTILTACDYADRMDVRDERDDRAYRSAMDDYRAGRLDAAIAGFEKAIRKDPGNASARFQLACLQQDVKRNFLEAYCGYREYLQQHPESDKAKLAKDRLAICEKELAKMLATKYGLNDSAAVGRELAETSKKLEDAEQRVAQAEKNLGESQARVRSLAQERDRLLKIVKGVESSSETATVAAKPSSVEVKDLLEEEDASERPAVPKGEVKNLLEEEDPSERPAVPKGEVAHLKAEEADEVAVSPAILQPQLAATNKLPIMRKEKPKKEQKQPLEHPETYVVQEGDTLYGVAKRFYGNAAAWKRIRDANKAIISMDNRLRAGDTIVLP